MQPLEIYQMKWNPMIHISFRIQNLFFSYIVGNKKSTDSKDVFLVIVILAIEKLLEVKKDYFEVICYLLNFTKCN